MPFPSSYRNVLIIYSAAYNNLAGALATDIEFELTQGDVPDKYDKNAVVIFSHSAPYSGPFGSQDDKYYATRGDYEAKTEPVLIRLYKDNGSVLLDTVKHYDSSFNEILPENMSRVLSDVKALCPSEQYGLLYTSHGSGWLPPRAQISTNSVGMHFNGNSSNRDEMDILDFEKALPMRLNYIIFDACYMGAVEVAYQLRSSCAYFVGSATEIPDGGFDYKNLTRRVFAEGGAELDGICDDYIGISSMGGIIAVIECNKLDALASEVKRLSDKYHKEIYQISEDGKRTTIQKYWCSSEYKYFYDLEDIFRHVGASQEELDQLSDRIRSAIIYETHTDCFTQGSLYLKNCCGLSMYLPSDDYSYHKANEYYKTLDFNKLTNLVE